MKGQSELEEALSSAVEGEVRFDRGARALYSTDASNYRHVPIGVVFPRTTDDVLAAVRVCHELGAPLLPRGGGTSLAGQGCNEAVILDFSRHLDRVEIDEENKLARVEPGVVLDDLRTAARRHQLDFGPDPATYDRCTLGGMLGNDACGMRSLLSELRGPGPRTSDHVDTLDVVTADGTQMRVGEVGEARMKEILARGGREAEIHRELAALRDRYGDAIRARFPDIPRRVSGYNLPALLPEQGFHIGKALVGSEATCAIIVGASLKLADAVSHRSLVVAGYPDVAAAGDAAPLVRALEATGCEGIDARMVDRMRQRNMHPAGRALLPEGRAWLLVELGADTAAEVTEAARRAAQKLEEAGAAVRLVDGAAEQAQLWSLRKSALAATSFAPGEADAWAGWEDAAVKPERLGDYLRDFLALLDRYDYGCSLYGHFGQGCIHGRIDFDLVTEKGIARFRDFTAEAAELVVRYDGSLSGEHGDGQARGDLLEVMFGSELLQAFGEFKGIWDPEARMNPGRMVEPRGRTEDLRLRGYQPEPPRTHFAFVEDEGDFSHAALRCVGVGKCRKTGTGTMCPSYMATRDEQHSTRGRAHLLFEMLHGGLIKDGWRSKEVAESLELCLSCKACKSECPAQVDVATYKAEFLAHHYKGRLRPRQAYLFGWIHRWARLGSLFPRLANFFASAPGLSRLLKAAGGIAPKRKLPRLARRTFRRDFRGGEGEREGEGKRVILWPDTFHNHFQPQVLEAARSVLVDAGFRVEIPDVALCCGRGLYDHGMLDTARRLWERTLTELEPAIEEEVPVIAVEPSCAVAFRDELRGLFPSDPRAQRLAELARPFAEALVELAPDYAPPRRTGRVLLQRHCQARAVVGGDGDRVLLERAGLDVNVLDAGCCGMAGGFGYEAAKYQVSVDVAERALLPALRDAGDDVMVVADGFSCRSQVSQLGRVRALHLAEVLSSSPDRA